MKNSHYNWHWEQLLAMVAVVVVLESVGWLAVFQGWFYRSTFSPLQQWWVGRAEQVVSLQKTVGKLVNTTAHIQDLELRLAEANAALAELDGLKQENKELRHLLENTDRPQQKTIITRPVVSLSKPAIAGGSDLQFEQGSLILSRETLLGQLTVIGKFESQVTLIFEKEALPILAITESGVKGIVRGDGKKILFTEVARAEVLRVGERVMTVGQPQVEKGILLGKIVTVEQDPIASAQTAVIEQYVSFYESPIVEVR